MIRTYVTSLLAPVLLAAAATAQLNCSDNLYKLWLTDANGAPAPVLVDPVTSLNYFQFETEAVYLAFDPTIPSGTYYVHVTDNLDGIGDMVLSTNDPMNRFVQVDNNGGAIALSLPFSSNTPTTGLGLNGVGQSLLLQPFTTNPSEPCRFKAWFGDSWDLTNGPRNPYLLAGGIHPTTGLCAVRSYDDFRVGDGNGTDVTGCVFEDTNQNGTRDPGEPGLAGWGVSLVNAQTTLSATTDSTGCYEFEDVACDDYTVELALQSGYIGTTSTSNPIEVCGCADVGAPDFGAVSAVLSCDGRTIGYWRNRHGLERVEQFGILPTLPALYIVDGDGNYVAPANTAGYKQWLKRANSVNMAYMLSAQLVAMHCNVIVGFVDPACMIADPQMGQMTIADLLQQATTALMADPFTPSGHAERANQAALKNALDRANNNQNWM